MSFHPSITKAWRLKLVTVFGLFFVVATILFSVTNTDVRAGLMHDVVGWAWGGSEAVVGATIAGPGWVSFNSTDCDSDGNGTVTVAESNNVPGCPTGAVSNYGVTVPSGVGAVLSGYAWSEHYGWISFNAADVAGCPTGVCNARRTATGIEGWARIVSIRDAASGWSGWLKLASDTETYTYGVTFDEVNGKFNGYAYSDEVGWFNMSATPTPVQPRLIVCSPSSFSLAVGGSPLGLKLYYWADRAAAPTCADRGEAAATEVTTMGNWVSTAPAVATIDNTTNKGEVTAVSPGSAPIVVTYNSIIVNQPVTVLPPGSRPRLVVCGGASPLSVGASANLTLHYWLDRASVPTCANIGEPGALNVTTDANWISLNPQIVSVNNISTNKGQVTAVTPGSAVIQGSYAGVNAEVVVTSNGLGIQPRLIVCSPFPSVEVGSSFNLKLYYWADRATAPTCADRGEAAATEVTTMGNWVSTNPEKVEVNNSGVNKGRVTGLEVGNAVIRGSYSGYMGNITMPAIAPAQQYLGVSTCPIPLNQNSCSTATATWDFSVGTGNYLVRNETTGQTIGSSVTGPATNFTMQHGQNLIKGTADGMPERQVIATASCSPGLFFNTHLGLNLCSTNPLLTIIEPVSRVGVIRSGQTFTFKFKVDAGYPVSCTVTGGVSVGNVIPHSGTPASKEYSVTTDPLKSSQVVEILCEVPGIPSSRQIEKVRINVLAVQQEI